MTTADKASSIPTSRKVLCAVYGAVAVAAFIATWSHVGPYLHSPTAFFVTFWRDTQANSATQFITADALFLGLAAAILMVVEARKHNVRFVWAYLVAAYFIGISVIFPLFLIVRELRMSRATDRPPVRSA
ncbi:hypothetical protein BST27_13570 [Mycobacterium intermedium]|uniref:DUF2834 domain-containing protein n=1 Tax=Mycobacterium intermedium TaxID=28445 RepID=A0A1E3SCG8_MYCIE|nr:DUF2834 domain-containing protein [Mycobacterium intermedium]MCV6962346.1 DUF2834 domain-containing protein [Mycobacterium intermedium]ODQ99833.1 hypothetical protein BHQ20_15405 [Mycobacterium intermedium]OPE51891.1 hypothetical protein BV508_04820 [Mycobacterium intermedium]ORB04991.1 hypothetical protein BST27_13570 [Mycobacterium intermedium]